MSFGPSTYDRTAATATYVLIESGWFWLGDTQVTIYWDGDLQYFGAAYLYNPYRSFQDGDAFPGSDGNNYAIGDHQETQSYSYSYTSGGASSSYVGNYEYYGVKQEIVIVTPDTDVTTTWPIGSLESSATTFSVNIASGSSATTYSVRTGSYSGTVVGSRKGNGNISVSDTPAAGSTKTYYLTAHVEVSDGGDGTVSNIETELVAKASEGSSSSEGGGTADYGVEIFDSAGVKTMSVGDTLGFISATATTGAISNSSYSGSLNLFAIGARVGDIPFIPVTINSKHSLSCTIPSDNNITVTYELIKNPSSGTSTYSVYIINKGD